MGNTNHKAIEDLRLMEAQAALQRDQAEAFRKKCHETRLLLEADVSTPAKRGIVDQSSVASVIAGRKSFLHKKTQQSQPAGHS